MPYYIKLINVFLLATVKYFYTPLYASIIGLDFYAAVISMILGGMVGFLVFYYFSKQVLELMNKLKSPISRFTPDRLRTQAHKRRHKKKLRMLNKNKFTRRNKLIARTKSEYGMWGIMLLTPVLLSIPLGAFLLRKYYQSNRMAVPFMLLFIAVEGFIICLTYWIIYDPSI